MAITAQQVMDRVKEHLGVPWKNSTVDVLHAGKADATVTGVVTTFAPSLEVLKRAVASNRNFIITREVPFWTPAAAPGFTGNGRGGPNKEALAKNPTYRLKQEFVAKNNLTIWRLAENWNARKESAQMIGLAKALGWDKAYNPSKGTPWALGGGYFTIPPSTLKETAIAIKAKLKMKSMRIIGDPATRVSKATLWPGFYKVPDLEKQLTEPGVDLMLIGEPVEWEASPYFADLVSSGQKKGMIVLGNEVSEEPGCGEMAAWLKTFVSEVPVEWIPAGEPSWMPY